MRPPARLGPRPLPLHLAWAATILASSPGASPSWKDGSPSWNPALWPAASGQALAALSESLGQSLKGHARPAEAFAEALAGAIRARAEAMLAGIRAYRRHPYRRDLPSPPVLWAEGTTRLLDYRASRDAGPVLLAVPSLINRAYVLDLAVEQSFLRFLAAQGIAPFLLDWDAPGPTERTFTLSDYVLRQERAIAALTTAAGRAPILLGYCMGGTLTTATAARRPASIAGMIALAAPWDFQVDQAAQAALLGSIYGTMMPLIDTLGEMPVDLIQSFFAALDPTLAMRKFLRFATLPPESEEARRFVALEDWLNDGIPLVAKVARECMLRWYGGNTPAKSAWEIAGEPVRPQHITVPTLHVVPMKDRIVPPASAAALAATVPQAERWTPTLGHIGMMASVAAPNTLWMPMAAWIKQHSGQ
jgi:polyhydroxyalkanoate synthase subunit PhaC